MAKKWFKKLFKSISQKICKICINEGGKILAKTLKNFY